MKLDSYLAVLQQNALFKGLTLAELEDLLDHCNLRIKTYQEGNLILETGQITKELAIVLKGCANISKEDYAGNAMLMARIDAGGHFAEAFACTGRPCSVLVESVGDTTVMWIPYNDIIEHDNRSIVSRNLIRIFSGKNLFLTERIDHLSKRTLREKVMTYLGDQARQHKSNTFDIPFDRKGLADYLATDRSALSAVLGGLKREGVIDFYKNSFRIL